jgi:hypothetical protein
VQHDGVSIGNDTPLVLTLKRLDAKALAMQVEVDEYFDVEHDVSFQEESSDSAADGLQCKRKLITESSEGAFSDQTIQQ